MNDRNEVYLRGTVVSLNMANKISTLRLCIEGERQHKNFPAINIYNPNLLNGIKLNQRIEVQGYMSNQLNRYESGKADVKTVVIANKVMPAKRHLLEFFSEDEIDGVEGGSAFDENIVILSGYVKSIYTPKNSNGDACILRIAIKEENAERHCDVSCFKKNAQYASMLDEGSKIAVTGYITTTIKEKEKTNIYFQNVICKDISLLK